MINRPLLTLVLLCSVMGVRAQINVLSFNIRYDNPRDGEHNWQYRKENVASLIQYYEADIIGMQEVLKSQLVDLELLLPGYAWEGVGRDDGKEAGEYSPVFYNSAKFEKVASATFWLSETCDIPGKMGWDAACNRVVTWLHLREKATGKAFFFFNTHFDHKGTTARLESARLIRRKIKEIAGDAPTILTGDFNCIPGSEPYQTLIADKGLQDAFTICQSPPYGQIGTFNGFKVPENDNERRIDIIFVNEAFAVKKHAILTDMWGGKFPSDHFPVLTRLVF